MYTTEKQAPERLTGRKRSGRRWLLIPALCAVLILAVVLIVELGKKPQVLPAETPATPISQEKPQEPEPTPEPVPELLTLVNPWNQVPEDWSVDLVTLPNGLEVDKRCYDALMEGYGLEDAKAKAGRQVAVPGTSEHQLGLAVDIVDVSYQLLDTNQENTGVQKWLLENSWRYGFILRYPTDKTDITGIVYEPWHYRYVGKEYAKEIYEKGVCLEQYLEQWGK